jgi:TPP-dependent pyruvate/acetoin dehydrogenase alpha subunit
VRAVGYRFRDVRVEGDDLFAVYEATREAVAPARAGGGPTLIEACTNRVVNATICSNDPWGTDEVK